MNGDGLPKTSDEIAVWNAALDAAIAALDCDCRRKTPCKDLACAKLAVERLRDFQMQCRWRTCGPTTSDQWIAVF